MEVDQRDKDMQNKQLLNNYYLWLLGIVDGAGYFIDDYNEMLWELFDTDFVWLIEMDSNRALDGLGLRYEYVNYYDGNPCPEFEWKEASVLEVLIALAHNWEHEITYDSRIGDRTAQWFWLMLKNLGLTEYPNWRFEKEKVDEIVKIWIFREFQKDGKGSPFPVKSGKGDQKKVEIWYQLQQFVLENVEI